MRTSLRNVRSCAFGLLTLLVWYVAAYVLMMDWRRPAFDPVAGHDLNRSACRFAPVALVHPLSPGGLHNIYLVFPRDCWANRVFWPIDFLVRRAPGPVGPRASPRDSPAAGGLVMAASVGNRAVSPAVERLPK